jgi:hypothetical protein
MYALCISTGTFLIVFYTYSFGLSISNRIRIFNDFADPYHLFYRYFKLEGILLYTSTREPGALQYFADEI